MRSFRLDPDSLGPTLRSWPALVLGLGLSALAFFLGRAQLWGRVGALLLFGACAGQLLRGEAQRRLREQYPNARRIWLLSTGMAILAAGAAWRVLERDAGNPRLHLAWLGPSFALILAFVLINRHDEDVLR